MHRRDFLLDRFLGSTYGTDPLRDYCRLRGIAFEQRAEGRFGAAEMARWKQAIAALTPQEQADVELELCQASELARRDSVYHLIDVCSGHGLPSDLVPGESAQSLWFLVHRREIFLEVYYNEEVLEIESWRNAATRPGIRLADPAKHRAAFDGMLRQFFRANEGTGRFLASQVLAFDDPDCAVFIGHVSDRLRLLDAFTDDGEHRPLRIRPSSPVICAYYPADGTVLLKSRHRAEGKVLSLLQGFSRNVLGADVDPLSIGNRFSLDRLTERFEPILPEGIAGVRVKAIELAYPASEGRRRLRLETNAADRTFAILDLLRDHVGGRANRRLRVSFAELQVNVFVRGRPKSYFIRLWPNRCSLNQTPTAQTLRRCLHMWGLTHGQQT